MTLRVFRIDATFAERNSRYVFDVLLKDHAALWDAIEELQRSVREKCSVERVHLHFDSDPSAVLSLVIFILTVTQILRQ